MSDPVKPQQPFVFAKVPENHVPAKYDLTKEQIEVAKKAFKTADPNKTGSVELSKIGDLLVKSFSTAGQNPPSQADISFFLAKYDLDKSGTISKDEYKRLLKELSGLKAYDKESVKKPKKEKEEKKDKKDKKEKKEEKK